MFWDALLDLFAQLWLGMHQMHRGGLGESRRGLEDFRRSRLVVLVLVILSVLGFVGYLLFR
jgi:hypothetical protein